MTKSEKLRQVHDTALTRCNTIGEALFAERKMNLEDRRFAYIDSSQWEGQLGNLYDNKPRFTVNKIGQAVERIFTQWSQNSVDVKFCPRDGSEGDNLSDTCNLLFRSDEQDSQADEAYYNAFRDAVAGGFGAFRLISVYEDEGDPENENQRIRILPIKDADSSVFFDLSAKLQDKSDARFAFIISFMSNDEYEEQFDRSPSSFPKTVSDSFLDWYTPDGVYVAEYFVKEDTTETLITYDTIAGEEVVKLSDLTDDKLMELELLNAEEVRRRKIKKTRVHKYIMDGTEILEDCGIIAGDNIPIVPVYGKVSYIDNLERCTGIVRDVKDVQRLKNMQVSGIAEIAAKSSYAKPIVSPEQMAGHQQMWAEDNVKNYPYLLLNPITDANGNSVPSGPISYTQPAAVPPSMGALLQLTESDIQDMLGKPASQMTNSPNVSGYALEIQQNMVESPNYIYLDNFKRALRRCGTIWLSMAKEIYTTENRKLRGVSKNGEVSTIELNQPVMDDQGMVVYKNDLSKLKHEVVVEVGASTSSQRQSIIRNVTTMLPMADESARPILMSVAMMNMEGEGMDSIRKYFRKQLVQMGVEEPTEQEAQQMAQAAQNIEPSANDVYLQAAAENEMAKAVKSRADTIKVMADVDKIKAETIKTLVETDELTKQDVTGFDILEDVATQINPNPAEPYGTDVLEIYDRYNNQQTSPSNIELMVDEQGNQKSPEQMKRSLTQNARELLPNPTDELTGI